MDLYLRKCGALPVSIGTSIALESIFIRQHPEYDPERKAPQAIILSNYQELWINIETLIRNIAGSTDRVTFFECNVDHVLEIVLSEIASITELLQIEGHNVCRPVFYFCNYQSLANEYKGRVTFHESTTVFQKEYDLKAQMVIKKLLKKTDQVLTFDDGELKPKYRTSAMIISSYPIDLTSAGKFLKLDLLESHTGLLKVQRQWNTKYRPINVDTSMKHLPFHRELLFVFGDKNHILPMHRTIRQAIYDQSIKDRWTAYTTRDRIRQAFQTCTKDPQELKLLMSL